MVASEKIRLAKLKLSLKPFALEVRKSGLMMQLPDTLIDSIAAQDISLCQRFLKELGLKQVAGGYWDRSDR